MCVLHAGTKKQIDAQKGGKRRAPGVEELVRRWEAGGAAVEAGSGWKKEERIPAEEKESSRLEPL